MELVKSLYVLKLHLLCFQLQSVLYTMDIDKMRNLHHHMKLKFGMESAVLLREWELWEKKLADFHYHRCFTLRCLKKKDYPS